MAIALRNRYRRSQLSEADREEITPKNIIMKGPTGVGKTEIVTVFRPVNGGYAFIREKIHTGRKIGYDKAGLGCACECYVIVAHHSHRLFATRFSLF